jgi:hypothetical protein
MVKSKRTKWPQKTIHKALNRRLDIEEHESTKSVGWTRVIQKIKQFMRLRYGTSRFTLVTNPVISHEWEKDQIVITTKLNTVRLIRT